MAGAPPASFLLMTLLAINGTRPWMLASAVLFGIGTGGDKTRGIAEVNLELSPA